MKKQEQLELIKSDLRFFGGILLHGRRRQARPISTREALHLVMRSSWARGPNSFLQPRNKNEISRLIRTTAKLYGIQTYQMAINSNHLHLVIRCFQRRNYKAFVRVLSGRIASHVMQRQSFKIFQAQCVSIAGRCPPNTEIQGLCQQFWQFRPWSRVLFWGRDFKNCCAYVIQNTLEAMGFVEYRPRSTKNRYSPLPVIGH